MTQTLGPTENDDKGDAACGLLLIEGGEGRRAALALSRPARIHAVEAVYPADGGPPEVASAAGRVISARSFSAAVGWPATPESIALDFGESCLLLPRVAKAARGARIETTGKGDALRRWWRCEDGAIVEVFTPARLLALADARPAPETAPTGVEVVCGDRTAIFPVGAVRRIWPAAALSVGARAASSVRVVDGARLLGAGSPAPPNCCVEFNHGRWALAVSRARLHFGAGAAEPSFDPRKLVAATVGRLIWPSEGLR